MDTVGTTTATSSLVMVPMAEPSAMVAPEGAESVTVNLVGLHHCVAPHRHLDGLGGLARAKVTVPVPAV